MKISELRKELKDLKNKYGDIEIEVKTEGYNGELSVPLTQVKIFENIDGSNFVFLY